MPRPGPLLRLVQSLERRRPAREFGLVLRVLRPGARAGQAPQVLVEQVVSGAGPRVFVVGAGERVDLALGGLGGVPGAVTSQEGEGILPRHIVLLVIPLAEQTLLRAIALHPERGFAVLPPPSWRDIARGQGDVGIDHPALEAVPQDVGSVVSDHDLRLAFDNLVLDVRFERRDANPDAPGLAAVQAPSLLEELPLGAQLAFARHPGGRGLSGASSSVGGPDAGGHAIPALVAFDPDDSGPAGALVLRARTGVHSVQLRPEELARGVLVGRSRRCMLGRGFDEHDGLSRVHAIVLGLDHPGHSGVYAFDLASRYGLRDVTKPTRLVGHARLDDGVGCLVYGAGALTWEPA